MIDAKTIHFVYFDLDDTILDHSHAELHALQDLASDEQYPLFNYSFEHIHSLYREINPVVWRKYSAGEFTKQQAKVGRFSQLLQRLGADTAGEDECDETSRLDGVSEALANEYLRCYSNHWKVIDGAENAFHLVASSFKVGILTNGFSEVQRAKMRQFPDLASTSEAVIISEEVGFLKPDRRLFDHAADIVGVSPENILYVGDSLHSDVGGGLNAGWKVAWYSDETHDHQDVLSFNAWSIFLKRLGLS